MTFTLRPAVPGDAVDIEAMRSAGWRASYQGLIEQDYLDSFVGDAERRRARIDENLPTTVEIVAVDDGGHIIGWGAGGPSRDDDVPAGRDVQEVWACYVAPARWGEGVGAAVFDHLVEALAPRGPEITLWVLEGNVRARRFYQSHGFAADGAAQPTSFPGEPIEVRYSRLNP